MFCLQPDGFLARAARASYSLQQCLSPHDTAPLEPRYIVIQVSGQAELHATLDYFVTPVAAHIKRSIHFVISPQGDIVQSVSCSRQALHLGESHWGVHNDLNRCTIGICLTNAGKLMSVGGEFKTWYGRAVSRHEVFVDDEDDSWQAFPEAQVGALMELCLALLGHLPIEDILGLDEVSNRFQCNPGAAFPLAEFKRSLQGLEATAGSAFLTCKATPIYCEPRADDLQVAPPLETDTPVVLEGLAGGGWAQISTHPGTPYENAVCGWVRRSALRVDREPVPPGPGFEALDFDLGELLRNESYDDDDDDEEV